MRRALTATTATLIGIGAALAPTITASAAAPTTTVVSVNNLVTDNGGYAPESTVGFAPTLRTCNRGANLGVPPMVNISQVGTPPSGGTLSWGFPGSEPGQAWGVPLVSATTTWSAISKIKLDLYNSPVGIIYLVATDSAGNTYTATSQIPVGTANAWSVLDLSDFKTRSYTWSTMQFATLPDFAANHPGLKVQVGAAFGCDGNAPFRVQNLAVTTSGMTTVQRLGVLNNKLIGGVVEIINGRHVTETSVRSGTQVEVVAGALLRGGQHPALYARTINQTSYVKIGTAYRDAVPWATWGPCGATFLNGTACIRFALWEKPKVTTNYRWLMPAGNGVRAAWSPVFTLRVTR